MVVEILRQVSELFEDSCRCLGIIVGGWIYLYISLLPPPGGPLGGPAPGGPPGGPRPNQIHRYIIRNLSY